ncbi:helicase associated domain-containing protein [Kitasatospora sp. NPDC050463]|uniref:helicase associated domain-containing protein n=1 Tax=Kitasatospora sp. NPDC050463 TaxID=3155786 RepID=UPI00340EA9F2
MWQRAYAVARQWWLEADGYVDWPALPEETVFEGEQLGRWVVAQRASFPRLESDRQDLLTAIGIEPDPALVAAKADGGGQAEDLPRGPLRPGPDRSGAVRRAGGPCAGAQTGEGTAQHLASTTAVEAKCAGGGQRCHLLPTQVVGQVMPARPLCLASRCRAGRLLPCSWVVRRPGAERVSPYRRTRAHPGCPGEWSR